MKRINLEFAQVREASMLAKINSPYIVHCIDSFLEDNHLFLVTEYCNKGNLESYIENQFDEPLTESKIWKITIQLLNGITELHHMSIIHRDINCKNIFVTKDGNIKLGDFGVI